MPSPRATRVPSLSTSADDPLLKLFIPPSPQNTSPSESLIHLAELLETFPIFKLIPEVRAITEDEILRLKQSKAPTTMDKQARAINALEPFLAQNKSAESSKAVAEVITQATSAPNTYVFTELLCTPNILELEKAEEKGYLELLKIYDFGVWKDYVGMC